VQQDAFLFEKYECFVSRNDDSSVDLFCNSTKQKYQRAGVSVIF
jgi:hypothetical protein